MKKYLSITLLATAFVILLVTLRSVSPFTLAPKPTQAPVSWIEFDNQFQQYHLKYPKNWFSNNDKNYLMITNYDTNNSRDTFDNWDNKVKIEIFYNDLGNEPFEDWVKAQNDGPMPSSVNHQSRYFQRGIYVFTVSVIGDTEKYKSEIDSIINSFSLYPSNSKTFQPLSANQNFDYGFEFGYPDFLKATYDTDRIIISQQNPYSSTFDFSFFFWPLGGEKNYPKEKGIIYKEIVSNGYIYRFAFDATAEDDYINQIVSTLKLNVRY